MNAKLHMKNEQHRMNYAVFYPDHFEHLPLMVYLHGAGERGDKIDHLNRHAIPRLIEEGKSYGAVILCPQCPATLVWENIVEELKKLIDQVAKEFQIEKDRICITGSSMGGFGAWMMGLTYPNFFSGIAPVAGGGMSARCSNLRTTPILSFHGEIDSAVPIVYSELMVNSVNASGGNAKLVRLPNLGHVDGIDEAYRNTNLIEWLLQQRRGNAEQVKEFLSDSF